MSELFWLVSVRADSFPLRSVVGLCSVYSSFCLRFCYSHVQFCVLLIAWVFVSFPRLKMLLLLLSNEAGIVVVLVAVFSCY